MNDIAAGFGSFLCSTAQEIGFAGAQIAHCYNSAANQQLGYSGLAALLVIAVIAFRRLARSA
jgi:hypothetical protein